MHKKTIFSGLVLSALSFSSCSEYSLMDDEAIRMGLFGEEYSENFENAYGKIAPDQTWDFSTINLRNLGLYGGPSSSTAATRAAYTGSVDANPASGIIKESKTEGIGIGSYGDYYAVEQGTLNWLNTHLPEGVQEPLNVTKGSPFVLGTPTNDFAIIPIYQGHAGMCWDLHLVDKTSKNDYTIWSKSDGIRYKIDYDDENVIGVAGHEIQYWDEVWVESTNYGRQQKRIPIGYIFKGYEESFGDLVLSCTLPSGAYINGRIMDVSYPGGTETFGDIDFKNGEDALVFSGTQTCTIPAATAKKMKENADNLYFEIWWNDGWKSDGVPCHFGSLQSNQYRAEFKITTTNKSSGNHTGWLYLDGTYSNEIAHTVNRPNVQAKPILINHEKIKGDFFLYLKITHQDPDNSAYAAANACQRSDEGMMVALPLDRPDNITDGYEYMVIGCEDSNTEISDWDVNDICFLIVGQGTLPKVKEVVAKRYMIEDLGSTYDFDFNDIVVDVTQTTQKNYDGTEYSKVQTAEIKTLGGTLPFKVKVGNTEFVEVNPNNYHSGTVPQRGFHPSAYGWSKMEITGWDPSTNNIKITVGTEAKDNATELETARNIDFPEEGKTPYIIACDQTVNWMDEMVSVPEAWFKTWPANYDNWPNHSQDTPGGDDTPNYGTEINYTTDGTYGLHINIGKILGDKSSITLTFVPQGGTTFNLSGKIGGSYQNGEEWPWVDTTSNFSGVTSAVEVTVNGLNDVTSHGVGTDYDAKISLWDSLINDVELTKSNITELFRPDNIKVYYK